ncbi:nuclear transport factor 2 family protein [Pedobacter psychrodurus]|uniref:Nuclear transport factor 2 family protein n=1 Tax=Pedobacter psychrodurus TaxID=2530456 RepID=A0A4R0PZE0_9SPHI|nr:nuclear transport factor 2 family protein [Pedobacter psychrodurus]TCD28620.1 nuclear transport factor 2 family protein [Pedobacter psychrodurus]
MSERNRSILLEGNAAITAGNHEGFLELCTEDTRWEFVGDRTIAGKQAVREYLAETYTEPPKFNVKDLITEGEYVIAVGEIELKERDGKWVKYDYCDVWRFRDGKLSDLRGFVIAKG